MNRYCHHNTGKDTHNHKYDYEVLLKMEGSTIWEVSALSSSSGILGERILAFPSYGCKEDSWLSCPRPKTRNLIHSNSRSKSEGRTASFRDISAQLLATSRSYKEFPAPVERDSESVHVRLALVDHGLPEIE